MHHTAEAGQRYRERVLRTQRASLIAYWPLDELSGTTALNAEGTTARNGAYTGSGITLARPGIGDGSVAAEFPGADTCVGVGSASLGAAWNGDKGSAIVWARIDQASRWADGLVGWWFHMRAADDVNYNVVMGKSASNTLQWRRRSGVAQAVTSVSKVVSAPTGWLFMGMTWDLAVPEIRAYDATGIVGTAATGFTTWASGTHVPNSPNISVLFAGSLTLQEWFGRGAHCAVWAGATLTAAEILSLSRP